MKAISRADEVHLGFQIAPMIDVVFVIMLFFMVMAGAVKVEREIGTRLPTCIFPPAEVTPPDELLIRIDEGGAVSLNDEVMADEREAIPSRLTNVLARIQQEAAARGSTTMVTLQTEPEARYQRIMDVMNCLAKAKIVDVTFAVGGDD